MTTLAGQSWRYMRVDQGIWHPDALKSYADLEALIAARNEAIDEQVLYLP